MSEITKEQVVDFIANMTVLELSQFIKELEEKFGVSAAAPAMGMMMAAPAAGGEAAPRLRRHLAPGVLAEHAAGRRRARGPSARRSGV